MAGVRLTGLASGLDTESLVQSLAQGYQMKVDNAKKQQTKAEWKKEAWANLNTKLMNFYKNSLTIFKSASTYQSKTVIGSLSGVKITAGANAVNGNHKVQVTHTATAQMWTGRKLNENEDGSARKYSATSYKAVTDTDMKISDLRDKNGYSIQTALYGSKFTVTAGDKTAEVEINVSGNNTVEDLLKNINDQLADQGIEGVEAGFANGALTFTNNTATRNPDEDSENTFIGGTNITITAGNQAGANLLGLSYSESEGGTSTEIKSLSETDINIAKGAVFAYKEEVNENASVTGSSKLVDLGIEAGTTIKLNGTEIVVDRTTTLNSLAKSMANAGINASYDANQGRFYLSSKDTGEKNAFTLTDDADGAALAALGLDLKKGDEGRIDAEDAQIVYNGVTYKSSNNTFNINGLTFEVSATGNEEQSFNVDADIDGIYQKVKNFVKDYNELITEMNKLYNAESSKGYEPLTSDEKDAMNDEDIENWEKKIKDSLLRRDSTISSLLSTMRTVLNKSVEVTNADGTTSRFSLSSLGIVTAGWSERGLLHIEGDEDDPDYAAYENKLKAALTNNSAAVSKVFSSLGGEIYNYMQKAMKSTESSSALTFYEDKRMDNEIKDYKDEVKALQKKLADEEEKYYKQFSAMETALAKLQSQQTYLAQLFGG